ncbi:cysteine desulfurase NifS [Thermovenabulum gondwanense]|uniref:Cysteine desulfurase IscS n=1 Tax=Thermovenabulum gondwanense TaxID=520767 RepID=A0A162M8V3_9FIRM|nr:cysteine desulfurase NifS [Thermovenabulum gondwanense]KYO64559.1 Cysteine desulfurase IscS [Thermovenabulum gondwanense]
MKRIYMDHAGTTPVRKEVVEAMLPYFTEKFGNASTVYSYGREARKAVEEAREKVAALIGADPKEVYFTSGGTEADNWALRGIAYANKEKGNHIITTAIEHHAVLHTCEDLEKKGFKVTYLPVDKYGRVRVEDVINAINDKTILISIMHANNEIGTIEPIEEIGQVLKNLDRKIYFHTDAVQTVGKIPVDVNKLNVDLLSISSHKIYGPKGVGALYIKKGTKIQSFMTGGGQEFGKRAGTENVSGIVGFGKAAELIASELEEQQKKLSYLRDKLIKGIMENISDVILNGHPVDRLPHNVNLCFKYIEGESLLLNLDLKGICASSGSACTSGSLEPSHVLLAIGLPHEIAHGSLRLTLGRDNTEEEIDYVVDAIKEIVEKLRQMSPLYNQKK